MRHEYAAAKHLSKGDKPDRVYGLRETKRFDNVLSSSCTSATKQGCTVRESITCSPFSPTADPLLFPFLILEAKSAKGNSWDEIQTQTAISLRTLLQLQQKLEDFAEPDISWESGPLVWFLSNKGEEWRVAASFVERSSMTSKHVCPISAAYLLHVNSR